MARWTIDKREGLLAYHLFYPLAIELSLAYVELDAVMVLAFAETKRAVARLTGRRIRRDG